MNSTDEHLYLVVFLIAETKYATKAVKEGFILAFGLRVHHGKGWHVDGDEAGEHTVRKQTEMDGPAHSTFSLFFFFQP